MIPKFKSLTVLGAHEPFPMILGKKVEKTTRVKEHKKPALKPGFSINEHGFLCYNPELTVRHKVFNDFITTLANLGYYSNTKSTEDAKEHVLRFVSNIRKPAVPTTLNETPSITSYVSDNDCLTPVGTDTQDSKSVVEVPCTFDYTQEVSKSVVDFFQNWCKEIRAAVHEEMILSDAPNNPHVRFTESEATPLISIDLKWSDKSIWHTSAKDVGLDLSERNEQKSPTIKNSVISYPIDSYIANAIDIIEKNGPDIESFSRRLDDVAVETCHSILKNIGGYHKPMVGFLLLSQEQIDQNLIEYATAVSRGIMSDELANKYSGRLGKDVGFFKYENYYRLKSKTPLVETLWHADGVLLFRTKTANVFVNITTQKVSRSTFLTTRP